MMRGNVANRLSRWSIVALSMVALLCVLSGYLQPPQPLQHDEGAAAHIFQLAIVALLPTIVCFVATADWKTPKLVLRFAAVPSTLLVLAFGALFYLEHVRS